MRAATLAGPRSRRARLFTPPVTSGLVRHYDARSLVGTFADGARATQWDDLGPHKAHLTPGASTPWFKRNAWDGKPGILFNGQVELTNTDNTGRPTKDMTVFAVASCGYKGAFPEVCNWGNGSTQGWDLYHYTGIAPLYRPSFITRRSGAAWGDHWAIQAGATRPQREEPAIITGFVSGGTTGVRWDKGNETTDSGTDANIDYGAGTVKLCVGHKFTANRMHGGIVHALMIYDRKLSAGEITLVEDWLDRQWRVTEAHRAYECWYNGSVDATSYRINYAWSPDGRSWKRRAAGPVLSQGAATTWDDSHVKDPCVVWDPDAGQWVMFYAGYDGATYRIGRATSTDRVTWTKYGSNPIVDVGAGGTFDDVHTYFPWVVYDPDDADANYRWKMLYGASDGTDISVGYASSPDGLTWTKRGQVLTKGSGGAWDSNGVSVGCFRKSGSEWQLWHQGVDASGVWQGGYATASDPAGPWTKDASNPQAPARANDAGRSRTLSGNMATTDAAVGLSAAHSVDLWEPMAVASNAAEMDLLSKAVEFPSSTVVATSNGPDNAMNTAAGATWRSIHYRSVITRSIVDLGGTIAAYGTTFQIMDDLGVAASKLKELSHRAVATAPEGPNEFDTEAGIMFAVDQDGTLVDHRAAENPCVVARRPGS